MHVRDILKHSIDLGRTVATAYLDDLDDAALMMRPHPACNHLKWQIGHLITSEHGIIESVVPGSMPPLPPGFRERYSKDTATNDDPAAFDSKAELMRVLAEQRAATLAALAALPDAEFDKPSPEPMRGYAPTVAAAFELQGSHWMMHAGQWVIVRRALGKPVVI